MDNFTATMIAEGQFELAGIEDGELTEEMYLEAWQHLVDTGLVWQLQGWFGRTAKYLIENGKIKENKQMNKAPQCTSCKEVLIKGDNQQHLEDTICVVCSDHI